MNQIVVVGVALWACFSSVTWARESVGEFTLSELHVRATLQGKEGRQAEFGVGDSSLGVSYNWDDQILAKVVLGELELRSRPGFYTQNGLDEALGFVEGYAEYVGLYGKVRMGLLPLGFGYEGKQKESEILRPRTLLYEKGLMGLRDMGLSLEFSHQGYYTELIVHNGEGFTNADQLLWFTAHWGRRNNFDFEWGVSAQTGQTNPLSTSGSSWSGVGFNPNAESKWRMGQAYARWYSKSWDIVMAGTMGAVIQSPDPVEGFWLAHVDIDYKAQESWTGLFRYQAFDASDLVTDDLAQVFSLGLARHSSYGLSSVYIVGSKYVDEQNDLFDDRLEAGWRLRYP